MKNYILLFKKHWFSIIIVAITLSLTHILVGTVCYSVLLFGIPCPTCGLTRAAKLMATGDFLASFQMHPLLILVILGVVLSVLLKIGTERYKLFMTLYVIITIVLFLCFYLYRMKYFFPYVEPMIYVEDNLLAKVVALIRALKHNRLT